MADAVVEPSNPTEAKHIIDCISLSRAEWRGSEALCIICSCMEHLGPKLNPSPKHYVSKLIQNADDCKYSGGNPKVIIQISGDIFLLTKNE